MAFGMKNWEDRLTWDQILEMERNGTDVSEIKANFLKKQAAEKAANEGFEKALNTLRFTMEKVEDSLIPNKTDITKIEKLVDDCKNPGSKIIKDTVGKPPFFGLFGKGKWEEGIKNSDVVFASVVQCHPQLWKKITDDITPASYLLVYSLNPKYMRNIEVLKKVSKLVNDFRELDSAELNGKYSPEMVKLHADLDNPQSTPHVVLDKTLLQEIGIAEDDANIRLAHDYAYGHTPLKNNQLPSDGMLPFIRHKEKDFGVDVNFAYAMSLIPSKYYE